jgi:hypothetical protein
VPNANPKTIPVDEPIDATAVLLLVQTPPDVTLLKVLVDPTQTTAEPVIAATELTVTAVVEKQPPDNV